MDLKSRPGDLYQCHPESCYLRHDRRFDFDKAEALACCQSMSMSSLHQADTGSSKCRPPLAELRDVLALERPGCLRVVDAIDGFQREPARAVGKVQGDAAADPAVAFGKKQYLRGRRDTAIG